jgi:hypothetical protein
MLEILTQHKLAVGSVAVLGVGGFLLLRSRARAKRAAQLQASKATQDSQTAYTATPTITSYPLTSLSGLGGGGGGGGGVNSGGTTSDGGYNSGSTPSAPAQTTQASLFDSMLALTGLNNNFTLAKNAQQNSFDLSIADKQDSYNLSKQKTGGLIDLGKILTDFGGSVDVTDSSIKVANNNPVNVADSKAAMDKSFVDSLYDKIGRSTTSANPRDAAGEAYWVSQLSSGTSYDKLASNFKTAATANKEDVSKLPA